MKKFICMMFCLVVALTASAVNYSAVDYTPPPKIEKVSILPVMEAPAMPVMEVQYLNVNDYSIVIPVMKDAPVTSQMAMGVPMFAYIEKRGYNKKFQPPECDNRKNMRQSMLNLTRYHNKH